MNVVCVLNFVPPSYEFCERSELFFEPHLPPFPQRMFIHATDPFRTKGNRAPIPWKPIPRVTSRPKQQLSARSADDMPPPFAQVPRTCSPATPFLQCQGWHHHELLITSINRLSGFAPVGELRSSRYFERDTCSETPPRLRRLSISRRSPASADRLLAPNLASCLSSSFSWTRPSS
jgi:hypothetical protein